MPDFSKYGYHIVPASKWVKMTTKQQEVFRKAGGFPVNDKFISLWDRPLTNKREILLLYGTYGSSKTVDRVTEHILLCLTQPYFKCYYGRNLFDLAKKEFHSIIVTCIKRLGVQEFFEYSEKPNGNKEIMCVSNGNKFKPFGCDDEESVKGWDDATHVLVDELNQIEFKMFGMLQSRLRKQGAPKCFTGMFNNCDVMPDHWIRTTLLNPDEIFTDDNGKPVERNIIEHLSFYTDNYFIDHDDYRNALIEQAGKDLERREAILNAHWGANTTAKPFYKNFRRSVHVGPCVYNPKLCLHVSFDENVNPYLPVGIFQLDGGNIYWIDEIAAVNPYNTLRWVCNEIYRKYGPSGLDHQAGMIIYGDATSRKDDVTKEKGKDFFILAKEYLEHFKPRVRVNKSNPNVAMRGNFINDVLSMNIYGLFITINPNCKHAIADFVNTAEAPDGNGKDKTKTTVDGIKGVQKWGHFSDLFDYMICEAHVRHYDTFRNGNRKAKWYAPRVITRHAF